MNILISAAGRRVRLVQLFRQALKTVGVEGRVHACDTNALAAALYAADDHFLTPPAGDPDHVPRVLRACSERGIRLLLTVNDNELVPYAEARQLFAQAGVHVAIMDAEATRMGHDKRLTHEWLEARGYPVARRWTEGALAKASVVPFPVIVKPARGSAGIGVRSVASEAELHRALSELPDPVVEELQTGAEYTVNVFASRAAEFVCAVPHVRLEVRAGEVSKGRTFRHPDLDHIARRLVAELPGCRGPFNFQGFLDDGSVCITEINPRFGGGYPLAHAAGARFPEWLVMEHLGRPVPTPFVDWESDIVMLRYDQEILVRQVAPGPIEPL